MSVRYSLCRTQPPKKSSKKKSQQPSAFSHQLNPPVLQRDERDLPTVAKPLAQPNRI
jgi:hypothetical protein